MDCEQLLFLLNTLRASKMAADRLDDSDEYNIAFRERMQCDISAQIKIVEKHMSRMVQGKSA